MARRRQRALAAAEADAEKAAVDDRKILEILKRRDARWTDVHLRDGKVLAVFNIAWGRDLGDEYAHVTTNCSPMQGDEVPIDFFYTWEVVAIVDSESGRTVYGTVGADGLPVVVTPTP